MELNKIYNIDCRDGIELLDDNSVDLVITSPPYNVDLGNNKYNVNPYNLYNDNKEHHEYIEFLEGVFARLYFKLKSGGRVCINIGDGKNGSVPTHSDIINFMTKKLYYIPMTTIIWDKNQIGSRTAWGSFMSPSCPSFPTPFEYILVFAKENKKLQYTGRSDIEKQEFIDWSLAMWKIAPETKQKKIGHPAMFPEELPKRLIKLFSYVDALVVDPFSGGGTTCLVANRLDRRYVGFEISEDYVKISEKRIKNSIRKIKFDI